MGLVPLRSSQETNYTNTNLVSQKSKGSSGGDQMVRNSLLEGKIPTGQRGYGA